MEYVHPFAILTLLSDCIHILCEHGSTEPRQDVPSEEIVSQPTVCNNRHVLIPATYPGQKTIPTGSEPRVASNALGIYTGILRL